MMSHETSNSRPVFYSYDRGMKCARNAHGAFKAQKSVFDQFYGRHAAVPLLDTNTADAYQDL